MSPSHAHTDSHGAAAAAAATAPLLRPASRSTLSSASSMLTASSIGGPASRARVFALQRQLSFASAVLSALCAGSIAVFSLYGPLFQERLRYSQLQVNGVAIAASIATYLPVPLLGYLCDRVGPAPLSALAAVLFAGGYGLAAVLYRRATTEVGIPPVLMAVALGVGDGTEAPETRSRLVYVAMLAAFVFIGVGTCAMYLSAVATCAKNFGKGKHRGLALAVPIAAYGLSGMWLSQVASQLLYERLSDGSKGDVDVFGFFVFLAILLPVVGAIGTFGLRVVDEQDLIDDAVEELERSGLLEGSAVLSRTESGYGTIDRRNPFVLGDDAETLDPNKTAEEDEARIKKQTVLNAETRRFLTDQTMWFFALGFFFMIGPGEAFINNLGTVIKTLYPPYINFIGKPTSPATHVSIVGLTSTVLRLLTGSLTDLLAPTPQSQHVQITHSTPMLQRLQFSVSRVTFLLFFAVVMSLGLVLLASGLVQNHGDRFWMVSVLVGAGYGAVFSLTPIIITVIWGVENFGTNWGIIAMMPCVGATLWGLIYSGVYQHGATHPPDGGGDGGDLFCYGAHCYAPTFWAMAASVWLACGLVFWAWRGKDGWKQRGIVI